jgi:hypothetical protein
VKPVPSCLLAAIKVLLKLNEVTGVMKFGIMMLSKCPIRCNEPALRKPHVNRILQISLWKGLGIIYLATFEFNTVDNKRIKRTVLQVTTGA